MSSPNDAEDPVIESKLPMKKKRLSYAIHPLFIAINMILFYFIGLRLPSPNAELIPASLLAVLFALGIWGLYYLILRKVVNSSILASLTIFLLLRFDGIFEMLVNSTLFSTPFKVFVTTMVGQYALLAMLLGCFAIITFLFLKIRRELVVISLFLDIAALFLVIFSVNNILKTPNLANYQVVNVDRSLAEKWEKIKHAEMEKLEATKAFQGDIYYLVFDAFGSEETLNEIYGTSSRSMLESLKEKGFRVIENGRTNYNQTQFSMASALNMDHIPMFASQLQPEMLHESTAVYLINHNLVFDYLRKNGYTVTSFTTGVSITEITASDQIIRPIDIPSPFISSLVNNTFLSLFFWKMQYGWHQKQIDSAIEWLKKEENSGSPKFVYAHIMIPHPAFIYTSTGEVIYPAKKFDLRDNNTFIQLDNLENYRSGYRGQVEYTMKKLLEIVDAIQARSPNAVILLQGDHGPGAFFQQEDPDISNLDEKFKILNAYYFPDQDYSLIGDEITPVNSFAVVFNKYFGTMIPLKENKSFYSSFTKPFEFSDITYKLK